MNKNVYMIGGPNGAGKTTAAMEVLPNFLSINEFVNADNIAAGLSPFNPDSMAVTAGKLMIKRMDELVKNGKSFAFETTCAAKFHVNTLNNCKNYGYNTTLIFFWLPSAELAIRRVQSRVAQGGHNIPEIDIKRRYKRGLENLINLYLPIVDNVTIYDNSAPLKEIILQKIIGNDVEINNLEKWKQIQEGAL